jgi:hypothetical protein
VVVLGGKLDGENVVEGKGVVVCGYSVDVGGAGA